MKKNKKCNSCKKKIDKDARTAWREVAPVFLHRSLPYKLICQYSTISFHQLTFTNSFTILQLCIIFKLVVENIPLEDVNTRLPSYFIILHLPSYNICQTVNTQSPPTQYFLVLENGENLLLHRMQCLVIAVFLLSVLSSNAKSFM